MQINLEFSRWRDAPRRAVCETSRIHIEYLDAIFIKVTELRFNNDSRTQQFLIMQRIYDNLQITR